MRIIFTLLLFASTCYTAIAQSAKLISDCTITYEVSVEDPKADPQVVKSMQGATKVVYIKGTRIRTDFVTPAFKQIVFFDSKSDSTIVLREIGPSRYISYLDEAKRTNQNKRFEGIQFNNTDERKVILGYDCIKVVAKLKDGSNYNIYYTPGIVTATKGYEPQFKNLPGFVLSYEELSEDGKTKVNYTATKITLVPVPIAVFDLPKSGYRVL